MRGRAGARLKVEWHNRNRGERCPIDNEEPGGKRIGQSDCL